MIKQPDQQIHDELIKKAEKLGLPAFPFLPDLSTEYPFMVVAYTQTLPLANKSRLIGEIACQVDVWGGADDRKLVSDWLGKLLFEFGQIKQIGTTHWSLTPSSSYEILKDNSTSENLYHGIMNLNFKFY